MVGAFSPTNINRDQIHVGRMHVASWSSLRRESRQGTAPAWPLFGVNHSQREDPLESPRTPQLEDEEQEEDDRDQYDDQGLRYRCRVAYDGAGFSGFQFQPGKRTIQGDLEAALSRRCNQSVRVVGAGRTDAGVHARGQAIHFDLKPAKTNSSLNELDLEQLQWSLNRMLPQDIRIWNLSIAPPPCIEMVKGRERMYKWNVMKKCHGKLYSYRFSTSPAMDPMERHSRWQLDLSGKNGLVSLDVVYLQKLLRYYEGTHDFRCFAGALEQTQKKRAARFQHTKKKRTTTEDDENAISIATPIVMNTVRTVHNLTLVDEGNENYRIDVVLHGALYKMVRNMVGTALDVCLGRSNMSEDQFQALLNPHDIDFKSMKPGRENNPCKPAPPQGLTLEWVFYDEGGTNF